MAQLAISAAGAAIGSMFGPVGAQIGWAAGSVIGAVVGPKPDGPRLSDTKVQVSSYGVPLPMVWGGYRLAGNVIWSTDLVESEGGGGKGGGGQASTFTYTVSSAVAICDGPIVGILKIWADAKLVYNVSSTATGDERMASEQFAQYMSIYLGTEAQTADPTIEAAEGVGTVEAYRGVAYVVFTDLPLEPYGNRIPSFSFEVVTAAVTGAAVVGPWVDDRGPAPVHGSGPTQYDQLRIRLNHPVDVDISISGTFTTLVDAVAAAAAAAGPRYTHVPAWFTSDNVLPNVFSGGSSISTDPDYCYAVVSVDPVSTFIDITGGFWPTASDFSALAVTDPENYELGSPVAMIAKGFSPQLQLYNGTFKRVWSTTYYSPPLLYSGAVCAGIDGPATFPPPSHFASIVSAPLVEIRISRVAQSPIDPDSVPLSEIVEDICVEAGLTAGQVDVTALTDLVDGYLVSRQMSARSALEPLRAAYFFDAVENGRQIVFVKRGAASIASIGADDLGASESAEIVELVESRRAQETELPAEVAVSYVVRAADYQTGVQQARRSTTGSQQIIGLELPIVMTDAKAAQVADVAMVDAWVGRNTRTISLTRKWTKLVPTDVVSVTDGEFSYVGQITSKTESGPTIELVLRDVAQATYSPAVTSSQTNGGGSVVSLRGDTIGEVMDIPMLRDSDSDAGWYVAAAGYTTAWRGAGIYHSDDGADYTLLANTTISATLGIAQTVLGDCLEGNVVDEANTVTVVMRAGTLSSVTRAQQLNGSNVALLGNEIVMFRDATLTATNTYRLNGLLRGRFGTEQHMATHSIAERFVLLDSSMISRVVRQVHDRGPGFVKLVSFGLALADTIATSIYSQAVALKPLSPVHLIAVPDPATPGNYQVSWVRRSRRSALWVDHTDVPLGEESEQYEVVVYEYPSSTVLSTTTATAQSATVAAASGNAIRVYQISATVGHGFPAEITIA